MNYQIGQTAIIQHTLTQDEFDRFASLSGDDNPIHVDPEYSKKTHFGKPVAHGMLLYSLISRVLGVQMPGPGSVQVEQTLKFPTPTYAGERVSVEVKISGFARDGLADISTNIIRPNGELSCEGSTLVRLPGAPLIPSTPAPLPEAGRREGPNTHRGLIVGRKATLSRAFTYKDLEAYRDLTGDENPVFSPEGQAGETGLIGPIVPGALLGGLISNLLGTRLPGRGTNWLKQKFYYPRPAYPDQSISAQVEVTRLRPEKELVNLRTLCTNPDSEVVCDGEALVLVKDLAA